MHRSRPAVYAALAAIILVTFVPPLFAQPTPIKVDGKIIKGYIAYMTAAEREGRRTLTPGYEKTAEWAAAKFKEWGLQPAGDTGTYLQAVPITGARGTFIWTTGIPELVISGHAFYTKDGDFAVDNQSTPAAVAIGEVVFVGYGISAPAKGLDEYAGVDVKGKIVVALKGSPKDAPEARGMGLGGGRGGAAAAPDTTPDPWAEEATDQAKAMAAYNNGAAAILLYNPTPPATGAQGFAGGGGGGQRREIAPSPFTRPFVVVSNITDPVFRWTMSRDPQEATRGFTVRLDAMRRDIKNKKPRSVATGLKAQVKGFQTVTLYGEPFKNNVSHNVVGMIEGSDPALKTQYVLLGGHLDHLGVQNGVVMNGADDDASGAATVMEIGRLMAVNKVKPKRTIVFALWCGEEQGLLGSNYWSQHPTVGASLDRVVTNFNMDMVGLGDGIGAPGALNFPAVFDVIMRDQQPDVAKAVHPSTAGPGGSDYSAFIEQGIEALALMTDGGVGHPDYHMESDDVDKIDEEILRKTGQFVLQGALNVANETSVNLIITDRLHIYNAMRMNVPDLVGGTRSTWDTLRATSTAELLGLAIDRIKQLKQPVTQPATGGRGAGAGGRGGAATGPRVNMGLPDAGLLSANAALIPMLVTTLDFGRVDVIRDDGVWFNNGLTENGRAAIKTLEANNIVVNLVKPSQKLLSDMIDAAAKPFVVTDVDVDGATAARMKAKNALLTIHCDPANAAGCITRIEAARKAFGDKGNLLFSMKNPAAATAAGGGRGGGAPANPQIEDAKRTVYLALIKAGWTKDEIYAMVGTSAAGGGGRGGGGGLGGNLAKLAAARPTT